MNKTTPEQNKALVLEAFDTLFNKRAEDGKLAEHWDVLQDEATKAESLSGLPMFGDRFPA